ncbi:MAG: SufD family Fe-S cluster assembly protein [Candidatus Diapherotrites archaeon]|uniref:SufD family Fe-S cluster assembly protein n=1 Tax=Candidatus Iainarchaeum sp. TaxID=3101447 RepID=A0A8T4L8E7_9ARCH|nr:SufD family Fe-S cluster assembly protein [Candidatus Diapherotrites archaeon]
MTPKTKERALTTFDYSKYDFRSDTKKYEIILDKGLNEKTVREISHIKNEPEWMLDLRLKALQAFQEKPLPKWGPDLSAINFDDIIYYMSAGKNKTDWKDVPDYIKNTFDKLGIPEAEKKFLGGVGAQFDSEVIYHNIRKDLEKLGVVFLSMDEGLKQYPELVKEYFNTVIPFDDNKFAALNTAVWSGGSFVYVPKNTKVEVPLQAYFRINAENMGQFERTLIIADEGAKVTYIEGCFTAGTEIVTENGHKPIEEVRVGEKVLTHAGEYKDVYQTQVRPYTGNLFTIEYFGDSSEKIEATEEHPFLVVKRQKAEYKNTAWEPGWQPANALLPGDYLAIPIDRQTEEKSVREFMVPMGKGGHGFKEETLTLETDADFFRLLGYYLSEGNTMGSHYLAFTFNKNETEYIEDTKRLLVKYFHKAPLQYKEYKNGISLVLCSTMAARFFERECGKGAAGKHAPAWAMREAPAKQMELVKGFWRGDGSFMLKQYGWGVKRLFRMNTISKTLAKQLQGLLLRLDIFAGLNEHKRSGKRRNIYCVHVGGGFLPKFAEIVDTVVANEVAVGKQSAWQAVKEVNAKSYAHISKEYAFVPIKSVSAREVEKVSVYNFSVEKDESYVAGGVAVHNCTAPKYSSESLHSAVVELIARPGATIRYTTIQNWANNIYNLVTKRAFAYRNATVEWVDGNLGSKVTQKYPSVYLMEEGAKAEILSVALASKGQRQDAGGKVVHLASNTTSTITSKSVSKDGGRATYRGLLKVFKGAKNVTSHVQCDALMLDPASRSDTYPTIEVDEPTADIGHEATVGKIGEDQIFYLMSRGLKEEEARTMIVMGFIREFTRSLPMEYAVELNRLIELEMENSVG